MKRITILINLMVLCLSGLFAQSPEKISYQAVVRNSSNQLVANANVGVRVSILQGNATGVAVYVETQTATTNANGLMTVAIGGGSVQQGVFANIEWADGPYFLKTETDPNGGSNYSVTSTQQLMSVPYALYAREAGSLVAEGCESISLCELQDTLAALRDTIALMQATLEALTNPYVESTPMVTTTVISYITQTSAYCGGIVTSMSNDPVTARGICWSTNPQPTLADAYTNDGAGVGSFTGLMSGLTPNTTYFARAYATNSLGTAYGAVVSFTTNDVTAVAELPTVITSPVTNVIQNHANCGGMVTADGGAPVTARGVCWNTTGNPSVTGTHSTDGSGLGEFTSNISGLTVNTTYYVRAYATNSAGTAYGEVISFTPGVSCPGTPTVTDYDGNTYNTVQIGTQCWMKENLRTTHFSNGDNIIMSGGSSGSSETVGYYYFPNDDVNLKPTYGLLYNVAAALNGAEADTINAVPSGIQGVCPNGWHLPSDSEFVILYNYLHDNSEYICGTDFDNIGKALADTIGWDVYTSWNECAIGYDLPSNNASGFSARAAGSRNGTLTPGQVSFYAGFWTATYAPVIYDYALDRQIFYELQYSSSNFVRQTDWTTDAWSVRCLKD